MAFSGNVQWGIRWDVHVVAIPIGAGPMTVPDQQGLKLNQGSLNGGGMITIGTTGATPTSGQISTACTTLGTNAAAAINTAAVLAQIQGWNTGGG